MVFWTLFPWWRPPQPFERDALPSPTTIPYERHGASAPLSLRLSVCSFLRAHFGNPPHHPLLCLPETFLGCQDHLFLVRDTTGCIVGCIWYRYTGRQWNTTEDIYTVDAFCIHPSWRKRGVGDYLLTSLHRYANEKGISRALFIKEGGILPILPLPAWSGIYTYRRISARPRVSGLLLLSTVEAYRWISVYMTCFPQTLLILDPGTSNQYWRGYRRGRQSILACIQNTYQRIPPHGERIGWVTVWLESPAITPAFRYEASLHISDSFHRQFEWIWSQRSWTGEGADWTEDGGFHGYTYQWSCSITPSYGILQ